MNEKKLDKVLSYLKIAREGERKRAERAGLGYLNSMLKCAELESLMLTEEEYHELNRRIQTEYITFPKEPYDYAQRSKSTFTYEKYKALKALISESEFTKFDKFVSMIEQTLGSTNFSGKEILIFIR